MHSDSCLGQKLRTHTPSSPFPPSSLTSFTRKLKRVTAEQGAQFVSYDPRTGTWRFTVEHFSRYGLFDDEDDDEDDEEGRSGDHGAGVGQEKPTPVGPASARRGRRRQVVDSDGEGGSPGAADPDSPRGLAGARPPPSAGLGLAWEEDDEEEREDMQQSACCVVCGRRGAWRGACSGCSGGGDGVQLKRRGGIDGLDLRR